ncbi:putative ribonuclease H-like domain-containing protein [Tanacetum coccineum]|uniref:Ribonuclease H-like domain-containing protein n=1 Tax=Tanacetum coccineum TaxID=301880 RepID=A0ABQ5DFA7_9ASTR
MASRAVLMKTGLRSLNTAKPVNTAHPKTKGSSTKRRSRYVPLGRKAKGRKITGKGTLKTGKLDFEDVYFVKELQFNLFSVLQMCDKKNSVLFTDTGCFVLSPDFKLADESQVLLKVPRKNNMYSVDMKNIVPKKGQITLRGLPSKRFENDQTCVACLKGKQQSLLLEAMQEEILQVQVTIGLDLDGFTTWQKSHRVHCKKGGNDYDEVYAPIARIDAIRLFLAYASFMDFVVYQIDVKSAFLYGKIKEEVYICKPLGFQDQSF